MEKAYIKAISYYLPDGVLTNELLVKDFPEWSVEKVASKIGVAERHVVAENETSKDLAYAASLKLFEENQISPGSIDFVLLCTQSPDYFLPTTACLLQDELNIPTSAGALDFNLGCSGYVYGLSLAKGLIAANIASSILLITSETYTKRIHPKDKGNRTIFGDGAAATLISTEGFAEIGDFVLGTDGSGSEDLIIRSGAFRHPERIDDIQFDDAGNPVSSDHLFMDGTKILNFTLESVPKLVEQTLLKNNNDHNDISLFIFHQANKYLMGFLRQKIRIEEERFYHYLEPVGNTVSSTIPIAIYEAKQEGRLIGNVLLAGFGVGYSWAGVVIKIID